MDNEKLADRLERRAENPYNLTELSTLADELREAASALRSSGEAVAWAVRDHGDGKLWMVDLSISHASKQAELNDDTFVPLYLHPATVTDEDVERALCAWVPGSEIDGAESGGARWNVASFIESEQAPFTNTTRHDVMRAALESFVRPAPPASTKGG